MSARRMTRRGLAKALAFSGAAVQFPGQMQAEPLQPNVSPSADWKEVHPGVWRATVGRPERYTPVSSRLVPPQEAGFFRLPKISASPLPPLEGHVTERGCVIELPLRNNELVYGLGLQFLSFGQRGKKKIVRVNADPKVDSVDSHAPVPFYVTTEGTGILVDTARALRHV